MNKPWKELIELRDKAFEARESARKLNGEYRDSIAWMTWVEAAKEVEESLLNVIRFTVDGEFLELSDYCDVVVSLNDIRKIRDVLNTLDLGPVEI